MTKLAYWAAIIAVSQLLLACGDNTDEKAEEPAVTQSEGEIIWTKNCKVCHAQGLNGAPIIGNKSMWKERITQGLPTLIDHATNGYGLMPAKGGKKDLPDEAVAKAVEYMVSKVQ